MNSFPESDVDADFYWRVHFLDKFWLILNKSESFQIPFSILNNFGIIWKHFGQTCGILTNLFIYFSVNFWTWVFEVEFCCSASRLFRGNSRPELWIWRFFHLKLHIYRFPPVLLADLSQCSFFLFPNSVQKTADGV